MRIVLDTNVLISGLFWRGTPAKVLDAWRAQAFGLVATAEILSEYQRVEAALRVKYPSVSATDSALVMSALFSTCELVEPIPLGAQICTDADDDKFIACALSGAVDHLVTGDRALLLAGASVGISTIKPAQLLARIGP